ncbi:NUDIX domain-containing protein [Ruania alkalisoli]|uniref:NUDIX domain-containing protein n=1 Tax=Ruania alkalisoli TaxID=2779775 RepID=A0A7M1SQ00_9MICO|nr:NUDIX domain-containing protein [Ruania alkalisoli]QOR69084.1 NUDIX domain-containing protein [Ruania alkalisoli]
MSGANLGPDWERLPDGTAYRQAARVVVFGDDGRVLLARGHDADQPERSWYFTIGGGIEPGESPRQAAVRELAEEAGLWVDPQVLVGPVLTRQARFDFFAETVRQDEVFFLAHVPAGSAVSTDGWTAVERGFMDEVCWWEAGDLAQVTREIFPAQLPALVRQWRSGWDGTVIHLGLQDERTTIASPATTRQASSASEEGHHR